MVLSTCMCQPPGCAPYPFYPHDNPIKQMHLYPPPTDEEIEDQEDEVSYFSDC